MNYTTEGIMRHQVDMQTAKLYSIDKSIKKISRNVFILAAIAVGSVIYFNKNKIMNISIVKGE